MSLPKNLLIFLSFIFLLTAIASASHDSSMADDDPFSGTNQESIIFIQDSAEAYVGGTDKAWPGVDVFEITDSTPRDDDTELDIRDDTCQIRWRSTTATGSRSYETVRNFEVGTHIEKQHDSWRDSDGFEYYGDDSVHREGGTISSEKPNWPLIDAMSGRDVNVEDGQEPYDLDGQERTSGLDETINDISGELRPGDAEGGASSYSKVYHELYGDIICADSVSGPGEWTLCHETLDQDDRILEAGGEDYQCDPNTGEWQEIDTDCEPTVHLGSEQIGSTHGYPIYDFFPEAQWNGEINQDGVCEYESTDSEVERPYDEYDPGMFQCWAEIDTSGLLTSGYTYTNHQAIGLDEHTDLGYGDVLQEEADDFCRFRIPDEVYQRNFGSVPAAVFYLNHNSIPTEGEVGSQAQQFVNDAFPYSGIQNHRFEYLGEAESRYADGDSTLRDTWESKGLENTGGYESRWSHNMDESVEAIDLDEEENEIISSSGTNLFRTDTASDSEPQELGSIAGSEILDLQVSEEQLDTVYLTVEEPVGGRIARMDTGTGDEQETYDTSQPMDTVKLSPDEENVLAANDTHLKSFDTDLNKQDMIMVGETSSEETQATISFDSDNNVYANSDNRIYYIEIENNEFEFSERADITSEYLQDSVRITGARNNPDRDEMHIAVDYTYHDDPERQRPEIARFESSGSSLDLQDNETTDAIYNQIRLDAQDDIIIAKSENHINRYSFDLDILVSEDSPVQGVNKISKTNTEDHVYYAQDSQDRYSRVSTDDETRLDMWDVANAHGEMNDFVTSDSDLNDHYYELESDASSGAIPGGFVPDCPEGTRWIYDEDEFGNEEWRCDDGISWDHNMFLPSFSTMDTAEEDNATVGFHIPAYNFHPEPNDYLGELDSELGEPRTFSNEIEDVADQDGFDIEASEIETVEAACWWGREIRLQDDSFTSDMQDGMESDGSWFSVRITELPNEETGNPLETVIPVANKLDTTEEMQDEHGLEGPTCGWAYIDTEGESWKQAGAAQNINDMDEDEREPWMAYMNDEYSGDQEYEESMEVSEFEELNDEAMSQFDNTGAQIDYNEPLQTDPSEWGTD